MGNSLDTLRTHRRRGSGQSRRNTPDSDSGSATSFAPSKASSNGGGDGNRTPNQNDALLKYFHPSTIKSVSHGCRFTMQQHVLLKKLFKINYMGVTEEDLRSGITVLDAGAATGIWIAEMEQEFPESQFFGLDLTFGLWSDTQIMFGSKKTRIVETDSFCRIPFKPNVFDYMRDTYKLRMLKELNSLLIVHEQANLFITPEAEWTQTIREFTRILKPGGILDLVEVDPSPSFDANNPSLSHAIAALTAVDFGGVDWRVASKVSHYVEASNAYTDIQVIRKTIPIGWDGELGQLSRIHMQDGQTAIMPLFAAGMNNGTPTTASAEELKQFSLSFFDALAACEAYVTVYRVTARKKKFVV